MIASKSIEFVFYDSHRVAELDPLFPHRSNMEKCQGAYTYQIILEKEQAGRVPTVQQLLDASFLSCNLKFEEVGCCSEKSITPGCERPVAIHVLLTNAYKLSVCVAPQAPSCLILQMPRFGKKYKMFPHIIPSTHLDLSDLLHNGDDRGQPFEFTF